MRRSMLGSVHCWEKRGERGLKMFRSEGALWSTHARAEYSAGCLGPSWLGMAKKKISSLVLLGWSALRMGWAVFFSPASSLCQVCWQPLETKAILCLLWACVCSWLRLARVHTCTHHLKHFGVWVADRWNTCLVVRACVLQIWGPGCKFTTTATATK